MEASSVDEFINLLRTTHYVEIVPEFTDSSTEYSYRKVLTKIYRDNASKYPTSMAPINNYLFIKQVEIDRLTTAIECIRYKLEPQDTLRYVME
jgi:V/A-type H+-transporting ATPase subunit C